ncbi:MAG: MerR family DNA-binding protein [[Lactobacillus] timonensis]|nr:MerR family DNA-binding protein [[Lactobacillus] timonensis]
MRLQQIITYRQLGFTLKDIQELIDNRQASKTLSALIDKQTAMLHQQIHQLESQLAGLRYFKKQLQSSNSFSPELQAKVRSNMKMAKQLHHFRLTMVGWGLVIDLLFLVSLIFVISQGASPWRLVLGGSFIASHLRTTYFFLLPAFTIPLPQLSFRIRPRVQKLGLSPSYPEYP